MKRFISVIFASAILVLVPGLSQAQQIYNGVSGGTLQQDSNAKDLQKVDSDSGQSTEPVVSNGGSETLKRLPSGTQLRVSGQAPETTQKDEGLGFYNLLFILFGVLMLVLLPLAYYIRLSRPLASPPKDPESEHKENSVHRTDQEQESKSLALENVENEKSKPKPKKSGSKKKNKSKKRRK